MVKFYLAPGVRNRKFYLAPGMKNGKIYLAPNDNFEKFNLAVKGLSTEFQYSTRKAIPKHSTREALGGQRCHVTASIAAQIKPQ